MKRKKSKKPNLTKKAREAKKKEYGRLLVNGADLGPALRDPSTGVVEAGPHIQEPKHCDDYIEDETQPECLRKFLERAREPGHGHLKTDPFPKLFADFDGKRVRVTMASRLGSIGWSDDLTREIGYEHRGWVEQLSNFGDKP